MIVTCHLLIKAGMTVHMPLFTLSVRIHMIEGNAAARKYRQQMRWFLFVFLLLTIQLLIWLVFLHTDHDKLLKYPYLSAYGRNFFVFMGIFNALVKLIKNISPTRSHLNITAT